MRGWDLQKIFDSISQFYESNNRLLSLGVNLWWRFKASKFLRGFDFLDLCSGSGEFLKYIFSKNPNLVVSLDFSKNMVSLAKKKFFRARFVLSDALELPFKDKRFDCVSLIFSLRNIDDKTQLLREVKRILRDDGRFLICDMYIPDIPLRGIFKIYLYRILPKIVSFFGRGKKEYYEYLAKSIISSPGWLSTFISNLDGFKIDICKPIFFGMAYIIVLRKGGDR